MSTRPLDVRAGLAGDAMMLTVAALWMAEATVRLPAGFLMTGAIYGYFAGRMLWLMPRAALPWRGLWALVPFPVICMASTLWSLAPEATLIAAVQVSFTLALGVFAGMRFGLRGLAWIVAAALGVAMALSALNLAGLWFPPIRGRAAFWGVFTNKNALGQRAALLLLTATCLMLEEQRGRRLIAAVLAALAFWMLILSASATGMLLGVGMTSIAALWILSRAQATRALVLCLLGGTLAAAAFLIWQLQVDPWQQMLAALGKSQTLTGRTFLWQIAIDKIDAAPALGNGYMAYWGAEATLQETQLIARLYGATVGSFHNFALEILVMTGILGAIGFGLLLTLSGRLLWAARTGPMGRWAWMAGLLLVQLSALGSSLYRPHEISLFLVVALGVAARNAVAAPAAVPYRWLVRPRAAST